MKKFYVLIIIIAMTATILPGCKKTSTETQPTNTTSGTTTPPKQDDTILSCEDTIKNYLKSTNQDGNGTRTIKAGDTITVDYVGRLDEKTVFDTSVESIAKACEKYNSARNYNEGLSFAVGGGQMIAGFDKAVEGMKVGQTKTIEIAPENAYGQRDAAKLLRVEKSKFPNPEQYKVGMDVMTSFGQKLKIKEITEKEIVLDANHELAGKTLIFDITIKTID